jgi:SAM-dependent methyltransferase
MNKVAEYWDKFVGSHLNSPDHWEANKVVQQTQWSYITGDPFKNPLHWFYERYGPFSNMASICCGSGLLERDIAINYLQNNAGFITGYDISPTSIQMASESCRGLRGVKFEVKDINVDTLSVESFDTIFAHGALHHVEKLDHCLGELRNALKPTGFCTLTTMLDPVDFNGLTFNFVWRKIF